MQIALLKKDAETQKLLNEVKTKELERCISEKNAKLKDSVSVDLLFQSADPFNYQLPGVVLEIWLSRNKPPQKPSGAELRAFAAKLFPIARYCHNSPQNRQKLLDAIRELPEDLLKELINADTGNNLSFIFADAAQRMDKETLKRYFHYSEGKPANWEFANRFWQLADEKDKDLIMKRFWTNSTARQKAVKFHRYPIKIF